MPLAVGDSAPLIALRDQNATERRSDQLDGKALVLFFYPKDDTTGCTKEAIDFTSLKPKFQRAGIDVIGVSPDPVKAHDKFIAKHGLAVTLLSDESRKMLETYGVWVEKSMYGKTSMGIERATYLIDAEGNIAQIWRKVKVAGHVDEVLAAVRAL